MSAAPAAAPKFKEGGCCDKAVKAGGACTHPCCVEAAAAGKVCEKCNPGAGGQGALPTAPKAEPAKPVVIAVTGMT